MMLVVYDDAARNSGFIDVGTLISRQSHDSVLLHKPEGNDGIRTLCEEI